MKGKGLKSIKTIKSMCKIKTLQLKFVDAILLASSLFIAIGCQNQAEKAELDKFKATAQIEEQNKEIVREVINAIDSGDLDKLGNLLSDDFALYPPGSHSTMAEGGFIQSQEYTFCCISRLDPQN